MKSEGDRRVPGVNRVPLQTKVEMCGLDPERAAAFEAESLDVSGRGLHLRTGYIPTLGTPLVCRLEDRGREIIAEGVVAWVQPGSQGGEFGLMFTALDSASVGTLRELTGLKDDSTAAQVDEPPCEPELPDGAAAHSEPSGPPEPLRNDPGSRVKLHIEGLSAPMKALVRDGTRSRVKVGSKLEFLKVGRRLEIENLDQNARRAACIDRVDVVLDPQSGVPQLVVALHYDDLDDITPDPTVIDQDPETLAAPDLPTGSVALGVTEQSGAAPDCRGPDDGDLADSDEYDEYDEYSEYSEPPPEEEVAQQVQAFQGTINVVAQRAGAAAQRTGAAMARLSGTAAAGVAKWARAAGGRVGQKRREQAVPRRRTAPPPKGALSSDGRRLRPQQGSSKDESKAAPPAAQRSFLPAQLMRSKPARRAVLGAGLLAVGIVSVTFALRRSEVEAAAAAAPEPESAPAVAAPQASAVARPSEQTKRVAARQPRRLRDASPRTPEGITANVPLFGPTQMATVEPAPLDPPPAAAVDDAPPAAKLRPVEDVDFDDEVVRGDTSWGKGRLHLPTIHRIRLDGAGKTLKGSVSATGFSVVIPGRKTLESGDAIARRDGRIARVATSNGQEGARISFRFRDSVPPYRVRLRKDFVEFAISAPD